MAEDGAEVTVLDSWEELDDSRIMNKKLEEIKISNQDDKKMTGSLVLENQDRTQYQPQVRILKRRSDPGATASSQQDASKGSVNKHNKTLEQREKEYAEARLRILGCASGGFETEQTTDNRPSPRQAQQNNNNNATDILRQPRGPDGSNGFDQLR
ncbi:SUZ domain-containing protein 1-like isoform X1 [Mizuhopecten yessoensis]|uniref:SUZ RNA-binding domain-containing n=1 Tax=Mizuhopecten yessoensis TaxID=6573 RepID=A0A210QD86_MIZYE|nr:SUZ domain-containing protein 1-like isoform X1 [Mizuhopecten yessoensis]OWF46690.1 SUZ domain-containing protein 1 [Mizuhopecten yessoensis]